MLQRFGSAFEDSAEKQHAYSNLQLSPSRDGLLDAALLEITATEAGNSILARRWWPIRLPSKRATLACYARVLAQMQCGRLSAVSEPPGTEGEAPSQPRLGGATDVERRQHLLLILQQLLTSKGVWAFEGELMAERGV
jgi:hypothetical protein